MTQITLEKPSLTTETLITGEALVEMGDIGRCESVYRSLTDMRIFTENDTLTGEEALPGFTISVTALFVD